MSSSEYIQYHFLRVAYKFKKNYIKYMELIWEVLEFILKQCDNITHRLNSGALESAHVGEED